MIICLFVFQPASTKPAAAKFFVTSCQQIFTVCLDRIHPTAPLPVPVCEKPYTGRRADATQNPKLVPDRERRLHHQCDAAGSDGHPVRRPSGAPRRAKSYLPASVDISWINDAERINSRGMSASGSMKIPASRP